MRFRFSSKLEFKNKLLQLGIKVVRGNYIRNKDIEKIVLAGIQEEESLEFVNKFKDKKATQEDLQKFVEEKGLDAEEIKDLMYDIYKNGIRNLSKPTIRSEEVIEKNSVTEQDLVSAIISVAKEAKFHTAKYSYWKCSEFSEAAVHVALELNLNAQLYSVNMHYNRRINDMNAGDKTGHTYFQIGNKYYDLTARQFGLEAPFPHIMNKPYPDSQKTALRSLDDGSQFWYDKIKKRIY